MTAKGRVVGLQKAGVDKALRGSDKMTRFARAANSLIMSIVRPYRSHLTVNTRFTGEGHAK